MTDEQIIRALECCASESSDKACNGCPFNEAKMCDKDRFALEKYTLSLINRQKAEIEKLKADSEMADGYADALERYAREKAINVFAERLKEKSKMPLGTLYGKLVYLTDIDNLVKELTEKGGESDA